MFLDVHFLETHQPTPAEAADGKLMSENVRKEMSDASGFPMHKIGARDLRHEMKQEALAAKGGRRPSAELV